MSLPENPLYLDSNGGVNVIQAALSKARQLQGIAGRDRAPATLRQRLADIDDAEMCAIKKTIENLQCKPTE